MRNTYIGVAGGFGTVIAGKHDTPYKMSTGSLDVFGDTYGDYNAVINSTHDARLNNVVAYISPDMSGFSLAVGYSSDIGSDDLPDTNANLDQDAISIAGMYNNGPIYASLAFQSVSDITGVDGEDTDAMKLGFGYKLPTNTQLGFVYENVEISTATKTDQDAIYFSVSHPIMADTNIKFAYGMLDESSSGANDGGDLLSIGVSKNMTKNAELYALYSQMDNDSAGDNGLSQGSGPDAATAGETASAFAVGLNLKSSSM
jgi:predicted porin